MSTARVTIRVEIDPPVRGCPSTLEWVHEQVTGVSGNPRFYGDGLTHAINEAAKSAIANAQVYVRKEEP